jgi:hypothetical protein
MTETCIIHPPLPPPQSRSQHFQKNCSECTRSHRRCVFQSADHPKCTRCNKMHLNCFFALSSQGRRNDLIRNRSSQQPTPPSPGSIFVRVGRRSDGLWSIIEISERDHYPPSTPCGLRGSSCCADVNNSPTNHPHPSPLAPGWFHVYSHKRSNCSRRTQCAAVAYSADAIPSSVRRRRNFRAKNKQQKQQRKLCTIVVPPEYYPTVSIEEIKRDIIVFDGGNSDCPSITPPHGVQWRRLHVSDLFIHDDLRDDVGLTFPRSTNGCLPFIRLPRATSLSIIGRYGLPQIHAALIACENLRTPLRRSDKKRVFTDFGKTPSYACVGPQVSRNSQKVFDSPSFMKKLPLKHWKALLWLMRRAEESYKDIADHQVISHIHHAKKAVPFKTFTTTDPQHGSAKFFGGIAFGSNVFLRCHTDQDFTMSISQVFLKGKLHYAVDDDVIVYFCFPTLGVSVPLRPGDYLLFNPLIPHCISSRCKYDDDIMCVSMYLKTAIVGMNDNSLELTPSQLKLADTFVKLI